VVEEDRTQRALALRQISHVVRARIAGRGLGEHSSKNANPRVQCANSDVMDAELPAPVPEYNFAAYAEGNNEDGKNKKLQGTGAAPRQGDAKFAEVLLREGVDAMRSGDVETGKTILRDYINATVGFEKLGAATGASPKSLIRMFGPRGNPQAKNFFSVIGYLQKQAGLHLHVTRG
jgi:hypothetical protein